eukprot:scaffold31709_cov41-Cyclotella_meneghiniana.AAC.6
MFDCMEDVDLDMPLDEEFAKMVEGDNEPSREEDDVATEEANIADDCDPAVMALAALGFGIKRVVFKLEGRLLFALGNGPNPRKMFRIPWLHSLFIWLLVVVFFKAPHSLNFYKSILLCSIGNQVWLLTLRYSKAIVAYRGPSFRPPPKPDPRWRTPVERELAFRAAVTYLPAAMFLISEIALRHGPILQCVTVGVHVQLILWWLSALRHTWCALIDQYTNVGRRRRHSSWRPTWLHSQMTTIIT